MPISGVNSKKTCNKRDKYIRLVTCCQIAQPPEKFGMEQRGFGEKLLRVISGLGIVVGSFFVTLLVLDIWSKYGSPTEPAPPSPIKIEEATYGANCGRGVKIGNATLLVAKSCDGRFACNFLVSVEELGDPAPGCGKDFSVRFKCEQEKGARNQRVAGEANRSTVRLNCDKSA